MNNLLAGVLPQEGGLDSSSSWKYSAAVYLCGLLTIAGVALGVHSIAVGHEHTFGVTRNVPWGILIAAYVFFVVTSTGLPGVIETPLLRRPWIASTVEHAYARKRPGSKEHCFCVCSFGSAL